MQAEHGLAFAIHEITASLFFASLMAIGASLNLILFDIISKSLVGTVVCGPPFGVGSTVHVHLGVALAEVRRHPAEATKGLCFAIGIVTLDGMDLGLFGPFRHEVARRTTDNPCVVFGPILLHQETLVLVAVGFIDRGGHHKMSDLLLAAVASLGTPNIQHLVIINLAVAPAAKTIVADPMQVRLAFAQDHVAL